MLWSGKETGIAIATKIPVAALIGKSNGGAKGGGGGRKRAASESDLFTKHFIFRTKTRKIITKLLHDIFTIVSRERSTEE